MIIHHNILLLFFIFKNEKHELKLKTNKMENEIILITGDRYWTDYKFILDILKQFKRENTSVMFIHGNCQGVDKIGARAAKVLGFEVISMPANWIKHGNAAGPIRNKEMVKKAVEYRDKGYKVHVLAFHPDIDNSKGTKNCIEEAEKKQLVVHKYKK
jgi:hypothetical protein